MTTVFDPNYREQLIKRINALSADQKAEWGKMNAYQMAKHCALCDDMFHGRLHIKRVLMGRLIGRMFLKKAVKEGVRFDKNAPTATVLKTTKDSGDMEQQKREWIDKIREYSDFRNENFVHPFFGKMTREQVGIFAYKHADHHLIQFGA